MWIAYMSGGMTEAYTALAAVIVLDIVCLAFFVL
jgi:hypothetical protein